MADNNLIAPNVHNVIIVGSGPAGYTAALYTARANLKPALISGNTPGGQLMITTDVDNYPGFIDGIMGPDLMNRMQKQAMRFDTKIVNAHIKKVDFSKDIFKLYDEKDNEYQSRSVIITTGAVAKWLGINGEMELQGHGVSACATCDGFFFKDKEVAVIGGGNSAVEEAIFLTKFASKVYLIHRRDTLRAEKILQDKLFANDKIAVIWNKKTEQIISEKNKKQVESISITDIKTNEKSILKVQGVFVAIGHSPMSDPFKPYLDMDNEGYIKTENDSCKTNIRGVFAAGDVQDKIYRQAVTAAGQGCMAALEATQYLESL